MMKTNFRTLMFFLIATMFITACAVQYKPVPGFQAQSIETGRYEKKVAQLVLILDGSYSMDEGYKGYR
ncbi:MAG: hypothetical protein PVG41_13150, partial [Desulfobacteraceae bacterium]